MLILFAEMDWGRIIELFIATLPATVAAIGGLLTAVTALIVGIRRGSALNAKLDDNTQITRAAANAAEENVKKIDSTLEKTKAEATEQAKKAATTIATQAVVVAKEVVKRAEESATKTTEAVQTLATAINGRMDELLREAREKAYAEGLAKGRAEKS